MRAEQEDVNASAMIMENVFDWKGQRQHKGLRLTAADQKTIAHALKVNLRITCPHVDDHSVPEIFMELAANNWLGDVDTIHDKALAVVKAYLAFELGDTAPLAALKRELKGTLAFMERHYSDVAHSPDVPLHVAAGVMEEEGNAHRYNAAALSRNLDKARDIIETGGLGRQKRLAQKSYPGLTKLVRR